VTESSAFVRVIVEGLGPISRAEFAVKPITVVVGKNSFGKSLLLNLMYLLSSTMPDFAELAERTDQRVNELIVHAYNLLKMKDLKMLSEVLTNILHEYFRGLGHAIGKNLMERFREFFSVDDVRDLLKGRIELQAPHISCSIEPKEDGLSLEFRNYEGVSLSVKRVECMPKPTPTPRPEEGGRMAAEECTIEFDILYNGESITRSVAGKIASKEDIVVTVGAIALSSVLFIELFPLSFGAGETLLLTDSRAGVLRMARSAIAYSLQYGRLFVPAKESTFLSAYNELMARFREGKILGGLGEMFEGFLAELGLRRVNVRMVGGYPETLVEDVWGRVLPIEEGPSGVREALCVAVALSTEEARSEALFVEEIESHLHPKALAKLIELAWKAVLTRREMGKPLFFIATTHNPVVLSKLNNLIIKTGGRSHELVTVIHLKEEGGKVVGEELRIDERGFDESALGEIFVELLEERGEAV